MIVGQLLGNVEVRSRRTDRRELIPGVAVQRAEPVGHADGGFAAFIQSGDAIVDIHHVRRFDGGVREVLVGRIERVVDLQGGIVAVYIAINDNVSIKVSSETR